MGNSRCKKAAAGLLAAAAGFAGIAGYPAQEAKAAIVFREDGTVEYEKGSTVKSIGKSADIIAGIRDDSTYDAENSSWDHSVSAEASETSETAQDSAQGSAQGGAQGRAEVDSSAVNAAVEGGDYGNLIFWDNGDAGNLYASIGMKWNENASCWIYNGEKIGAIYVEDGSFSTYDTGEDEEHALWISREAGDGAVTFRAEKMSMEDFTQRYNEKIKKDERASGK